VPGGGPVPNGCTKVLVNDHYIAPCTGNANNCVTTSPVFGTNGSCVLHEGGNSCDKVGAHASCWVNPGDDPPPPPPDNNKCGAVCTSSSQCNGLTCAPAGVCYGTVCDTGNTPPNHRVRIKVFNCNNQPAGQVRVSAPGWGNSCTTNGSGECVVGKGTSCNTEQKPTGILVGFDAGGGETNYYNRVDNPVFQRGSCADINCNYKTGTMNSAPIREGYYIDMTGESQNTFTYKFCATSDSGANTGFNFKQVNCGSTNAFPNISISGPSSGIVGSSYAWTLTASDADDGVEVYGASIRNDNVNPNSWSTVDYRDPPAPAGNISTATDEGANHDPWRCDVAGTYTIAAYAEDVAGQVCSGNPTGSAIRCASNPNDRKTFTCTNSSTNCTGVTINCTGMCTNNTVNPKQARYTCTWTAPNGDADTAFAVKLRENNGSWGSAYYKISSATSDASLFTKSGNNWTFTYTPTTPTNIPDLLRGFAVRVYTSSACVVQTNAYGTERTIGPFCAAPPNCTGVNINCSGVCTNNNSNPKQSRYTCTWTAPNGDADTAFAVKLRQNDGTSWGSAYYKISSAASDESLFTNTGNNWTFTYTPPTPTNISDLLRGFAVRVYSSSACNEQDNAYGTERTVGPFCTSNPVCSSGPTLTCGGTCNASGGGYTATCTWVKPTGATNFLMQYKAASASTWTTDSANTGNVTSWSKSFNTDVARDFRIKIKTSTACTPVADDSNGGYGAVDTITAPVCTAPGTCLGVTISCGGTCNASGGGYTADCTWVKPSGATNFLMQYKAASASTWTTDSANTGNVSTWTKSFTTDVSRNFRLKIKTSSACTPNSDDATGGYGAASTITSPVCSSTGTCPGVSISCSNVCNASNGYNATCTWVKPANTNNFEMQYKNSTASAWTTDSPMTGNVTTWTKSFADPTRARDFRLRVSGVTASATCTIDPTEFGPVSSVGALTCTADAEPNLTFDPPATSCANQALSLTATASDADGIQKVEFAYKRNNQTAWTVGSTDTQAPYAYTIPANTLNAGTTYNLRATATDNSNPNQTTTLVRNITIDTTANCSGGTSSFTIDKIKTSNKPIPDSGDTVTFRIDVENTGTTTLNNLVITDTVPSYTTFRAASSTDGWSCANNNAGANCTFPTIASLPAGNTQSVTYAVRVIDNYKQAGVNMGSSNTACATFTGQNQKCDTLNFDLADATSGGAAVSITKSIDTGKSDNTPGGYTVGDDVVFDLLVSNPSTSTTLSNIILTETVPANMNFVSGTSSDGWSCSGSACSLTLGTVTIAPGASRTYEFGTRVRNNYIPTAGVNMTTTNEACVTATGATESCDELVVDLADAEDSGGALTLGITKSISTANSTPNPPYDAGDKIAFAILIDNNNTTSVTGLSVVDSVPQYTTFDATTSNSLSPGNATWNCNAGGICTFNAGSLNASASKTVYFVVDVNSNYTPSSGNMRTTNEACVTSNEVTTAVCDDIVADLVDASNTNASLVVTQTLDTAKTGKVEPYAASDIVFIEIQVRNSSTTQATNVVLTDTILGNKARQSVASANAYNTGTWSCSTNKICTFDVGNIPANTTRTYFFAEIITNYSSPVGANAQTTNSACAVGSNSTEACDELTIDLVDNVSAPSFTINQIIVNNSSAPFDANEDIAFQVEVVNTGNVQLSNVAITDELSNLVTFNDSATTSNWNCSSTTCSLNVGFLNAGATYTADIVLKVKPDYFALGGFSYGDDARDNNRVTATEALLPSVSDNIFFDLVDLTTQPTTFVGYIHYLEEGQNCTDISDSNRLSSDKLDLVSGQNPRVLFEFTDTPPTSVNINPYNYASGFDVASLRDIPLPLDARLRVTLSNLNNLEPSIPGEFEFPCARLNGSAIGKANANRTNYTDVNEGATNTILVGLRIKPFKPWFQLEDGDIYTGGQLTQSLPTPPSPKMITGVGNLFSDGGAFTDFSARGVNVRDFVSAGASSWLDEFGFAATSGDSISGSNLQGKIYRGNAGDLNNWLSSNSTYSVNGDELAVYFVTGTGDVTFANPNGLTSSNNGRLLIITKGDVLFNPSFGQSSSGVAGEFGILAEGTIDFIHQTGVEPVPQILRLEGIFASGTGGGINITRRCALNELQPSIIFNYDDRYYEKIIELENSTSYGLGMSQVEVTNWEVLD
jgi:uncharacterized repeat protein (TIGR01451 family)